jgi:hypothetical protein
MAATGNAHGGHSKNYSIALHWVTYHRGWTMEDKMALLEAASNPRRATLDDAVSLSKLFASTFMDDPLFDYMVRPGAGRTAALEMFFHEILRARDIPQGEVWMSSDGHACVCWLKPDARRSPCGQSFQALRFDFYGRSPV